MQYIKDYLRKLVYKEPRNILAEPPIPYEPPKFEVDDPKAAEYLEEFGYVVFKDVATEAEVIKARDLFWDFAEQAQGFEGKPAIYRDDPSSWDTIFWVGDSYTGIVFRNGIGQSPFLWHCRTIPKVKTAFTTVWGDDDLLVSYDGCGVFRPPEFKPEWKTYGGWYHIDQNVYRKQGRHAVQGLLNLYPSGKNDGGLVVVPRTTHLIEKAFKENDNLCNKESDRDFVHINNEAQWWKSAQAEVTNEYDYRPVKLCLNVGDFAMWDSRCIHCNGPPDRLSDDPDAPKTLKRLAAYVCMTPTKSAQNLDQLINQRTFAFQKGMSTTHWPHQFQPNSTQHFANEYRVGSQHVNLTKEHIRLIIGNQSEKDVYAPIDPTTVVMPW